MPGTSLEIGITQLPGDDTFTATMEGIGIRLADFVPVYDALYDAFRKIESARFDAEGPGWKQLAESTVASRGSAHPILNVTGRLRRSLTTKGAPGAVVEYEVDGLFMGTSDPVAHYHQDGTHGAGRDHNIDMVARPVVDMQEEDAVTFATILSDYFYYNLGVFASSGVFATDSEGL